MPQDFPTTQSMSAARFATWSIVLAVLFIIVGLLAILAPVVTGVAITFIVAWVIAVSGVLHLLFAWRVRTAGLRIWELLIGFVCLFGGFSLLLHPLTGLLTLTLLLASYLLLKGVFEIIQYFRTSPRRGPLVLILDGAVNVFLAIIIWSQWPSSSGWVIGTLVGVSILFSGISRLLLSLAAKRALPMI